MTLLISCLSVFMFCACATHVTAQTNSAPATKSTAPQNTKASAEKTNTATKPAPEPAPEPEPVDPEAEMIKYIKALKDEMARRKKLKTMSSQMDASVQKALSRFDKAKNQNQINTNSLLYEMENNLKNSQQQLENAAYEMERQSALMEQIGKKK